MKNTAIKLTISLLLALGASLTALAQETLPPLENGVAPKTVEQLWAGYDPRREPLETQINKEWKQDGVVLRVVRYRIGIFKGQKSIMTAIYGYPEGGTNLPGLVQIHGGGQSANINAVVTNAKRGYACISLNWAGNPLGGVDNYQGPNTDWGAVDATQHTHDDHFHSAQPDSKTLDSVVSARNNNWFLITLAARRALTFLEQQPEVDGTRLGVYGHSMGGNLTLYVAATDPRVKAGVITSAGGIEDGSDNQKDTPFNNAAYAQRITCPVLFINPSDDFHGTILGVEETAETIQSKDFRLVRPPQLNHRSMPEFTVAGMLWFDHYLQGAALLPETPGVTWKLNGPHATPLMTVRTDASQPCQSVDVYYTQDGLQTDPKSVPNSINRYWHHVAAYKTGTGWQARLPIFNVNQPLWAYANVRYALPGPVTGAGFYYALYTATNFSISSKLLMASPERLQAAHVKPALKVSRLIESFAPGWQGDWYTYNEAGEWPWRTHKLHVSEWPAPSGARLVVDVRSAQPNKLVIQLDDYAAQADLNGSDQWQTVSFAVPDFHDITGAGLSEWSQFGELVLADAVTL
ncbi:MAG TPA: dienelactone hydrolase family protein, partial [Verrucomicrobiae bacterium]